jgi:hypothetical protein
MVKPWLWIALYAGSVVLAQQLAPTEVSRAEIEARARAYENHMNDLEDAIHRNQAAIERNQIAIAEMHGQQRTWNTIISILSGGSVVVSFAAARRKPKEDKT